MPNPSLSVVLGAAMVVVAVGASAQAPAASRLDDVIKAGRLKVCSPGDYKPFSFQKPDGGFEGLDVDLVTRRPSRSAPKPRW